MTLTSGGTSQGVIQGAWLLFIISYGFFGPLCIKFPLLAPQSGAYSRGAIQNIRGATEALLSTMYISDDKLFNFTPFIYRQDLNVSFLKGQKYKLQNSVEKISNEVHVRLQRPLTEEAVPSFN